MRKPASLALEFLNPGPDKVRTPQENADVDTSQELINNLQDNSEQTESIDHDDQNISKGENTEEPIQYMEFEEFHPQSYVYSESLHSESKPPIQESPANQIKEPPAPSNKRNTNNFAFPTKGNGFSSLKKQLQVNIPEQTENNNKSSYEQTMIKQQQFTNNNQELKQQIKELQMELESQKQQSKDQLSEITIEKFDLKHQLEKEREITEKLQKENEELLQKLQQYESQQKFEITSTDQLTCHSKMSDGEKISYLIERIQQKSTENAKLQYNLLTLQNQIEILQTKQLMQANIKSESEYLSDYHSPLQFGMNPPKGTKKEQKSASQQQHLNLSGTQQKQLINLSQVISPLARAFKSNHPPKNLTTHQPRTQQFKEDIFQNIKNLHTKNSTSVGELNSIRADVSQNCSNILQMVMRKESYSTQSPDKLIQATKKFKEALNSRLQNNQDKHKSYASLLFSLGDRPKNPDQNSPPKQSQRISHQIQHPNSRKQSETIKSEESHKLSLDHGKLLEKDSMYRKDIIQLMNEIKSSKIGTLIPSKINYTKQHQRPSMIYPRATITESKSSRRDKSNFH